MVYCYSEIFQKFPDFFLTFTLEKKEQILVLFLSLFFLIKDQKKEESKSERFR
jgi:hypothetical protein